VNSGTNASRKYLIFLLLKEIVKIVITSLNNSVAFSILLLKEFGCFMLFRAKKLK